MFSQIHQRLVKKQAMISKDDVHNIYCINASLQLSTHPAAVCNDTRAVLQTKHEGSDKILQMDIRLDALWQIVGYSSKSPSYSVLHIDNRILHHLNQEWKSLVYKWYQQIGARAIQNGSK